MGHVPKTKSLKPKKGHLVVSNQYRHKILFKAKLGKIPAEYNIFRAGVTGDTRRSFVKADQFVWTPGILGQLPKRDFAAILGALSLASQVALIELLARSLDGRNGDYFRVWHQQNKQNNLLK